jgi:putative glutamine amidotransferase
MKKIFSFLFIFLFCLPTIAFPQGQGTIQQNKTLLLMHPTVGTISGMKSLIDSGIFPVKDITLKGVYFEKESYDYSESEQYIKENNLPLELIKVEENLQAGKLYCKNACSPVFEKLFNESSGVIFFGGPDIPPAIYGEKTLTLTDIYDPYRHYFEASFLFHLLGGFQDMNYIPLLEKNPDYLVVGFCLGMQTLNVATGGTMIQDIPLEVYKKKNVEDILRLSSDKQHRNYETNIEDSLNLFWGNIHPIKITDDSWIAKERLVKTGQYPAVVSSHHQAAEKTGRNLKVDATSMDGKIIEAMSHTKYPNVLAFQFHPEVPEIYNYNNSILFRKNEKPESLRKVIEDGNGYEFHLALWKQFAVVLNGK